MSDVMPTTKEILISALKEHGIGLIERYHEKASGNRKWSLEFYPLDEEKLKEERKTLLFKISGEKGTLIPITQPKVYANTRDRLYGGSLLVALDAWLNNIAVEIKFPEEELMQLRKKASDLEPASGEVKYEKLFNISFVGMHSLTQALMMDAIENG